jgi:hypothetical protein
MESRKSSRTLALSKPPDIHFPVGQSVLSRRWIEVAAVGALIMVVSVLLARNAMRRFDFFDMSAFLDAGYRVYSGQIPYTDFFYFAGPVHLYMHAFFFSLFGFTKSAVQAHIVLTSALVIVFLYVYCRRRFSIGISLLVTTVGALAYYGPISHPWYDQNAWLWMILPLCVLGRQLPFGSPREALLVGAACGVGSALAFLTKANVGVFAGVVSLAGLLICRYRRRALLGYALGGLATLGFIVFLLVDPGAWYFQNFVAYKTGERFQRLDYLQLLFSRETHGRLGQLGLIAVGLTLVLGGLKALRHQMPYALLFFGVVLASILSAWTGSMIHTGNIPALGLEAALFATLVSLIPSESNWLPSWVIKLGKLGLIAGTAGWLLTVAGNQVRNLDVWNWRASNAQNDYKIRTKAFRDWRCHSAYGRDLDEAVARIQANVPRDESLFIYPDMTVIYGLTGRPSFKGAPFIFHAGVSPPPGPIAEKFRDRFLADPPQWILLREPFEIPWALDRRGLEIIGISQFIESSYEEQWKFGYFMLLKLKEARLN